MTDHPITRCSSILALPLAKLPRISLHSSQNDNVVLFSVVRSSSRNETNRFRVNHLHAAIARFPQTVEILRTGRVPVAQQFTTVFSTKNG
jgi:hypothetical protein